MSNEEHFTFVNTGSGHGKLFDEYENLTSAKMADLDIQITSYLRSQNPELIVTTIPSSNINLLSFAYAGQAEAHLDTETESVARWRGFVPPPPRGGNGGGGSGQLAEAIFFAKYHYKWSQEDFILYTVGSGYSQIQYVLKEPRGDEKQLSHSSATDALITAVGAWQYREVKGIWVYDYYWRLDPQLYQQVQDASWDKVILDPEMKKDLTEVSEKFFDSKDVYDDLGVPWKRGLMFHGPAGNGKTISIKALMHTLSQRNPPIPTLYVKAASRTFDIRAVFVKARQLAPCMLILEDIDTIVTPATRSYFFNEVDGLESNDGILVIASTNHLDRLDPGLSKRPSRFDRKYLFPLPSKNERIEYCQYWRRKLHSKRSIVFPSKLCPAIADITHGFSFAYMQEAFVASLLEIAHDHTDRTSSHHANLKRGYNNDSPDDDDDDLEQYELWRVIKHQVKILRDDMDNSALSSPAPPRGCRQSSVPHFPGAYPDPARPLRQTPSPPLGMPKLGDLAGTAAIGGNGLGIDRQPQLGWLPLRSVQSLNLQRGPIVEDGMEIEMDPQLRALSGQPVAKRPFMNSAAYDWKWTGF